MKFPNWFRIGWWAVLLAIVTWLVSKRYADFIGGHSSSADVLFFLIWIALLLAPVFQEVNLLGVSLKQRIEELKQQLVSLRTEIRNSVDVTTSFSPSIQIPAPPPDTQLPALEERIKRVLEEFIRRHGTRPAEVPSDEMPVPNDALYLFKVR